MTQESLISRTDRTLFDLNFKAIQSQLTELIELMRSAQPDELAKLRAENQRIKQDTRTELNAVHSNLANMGNQVQTLLNSAKRGEV